MFFCAKHLIFLLIASVLLSPIASHAQEACRAETQDENFQQIVNLANQVNHIEEKMQCSPEDKKYYKETCMESLKCVAASSAFKHKKAIKLVADVTDLDLNKFRDPKECLNLSNDCGARALLGIARSFQDMAVGLWDAVKAGSFFVVKAQAWALAKAKQKWNSFWSSSSKMEDVTSDVAYVASKINAENAKEMYIKAEVWKLRMIKNLWEGVQTWLSHNAYCQEWEGAPHYSECAKPKDMGCSSCGSNLAGSCSLVGLLAVDFADLFMTFGAGKAIVWTPKLANKVFKSEKLIDAAKAASKATRRTDLDLSVLKNRSKLAWEPDGGDDVLDQYHHILKKDAGLSDEESVKILKECLDGDGGPKSFYSCFGRELKKNLPDGNEDLSEAYRAVQAYTYENAKRLNTILRGKEHNYNEIMLMSFEEEIKHIDHFIENSPKNALPLYRWTRTRPHIMDEIEKARQTGEKVVVDKAYMSSSTNLEINEGFIKNYKKYDSKKTLFIMETEEAADVAHLSAMPQEREVLVARSQEWEISEVLKAKSLCEGKGKAVKETYDELVVVLANGKTDRQAQVSGKVLEMLCQ